jgi:hypothetical protein
MAIRVRPRSKYGAVKTVVDGIRFDSKKESERYRELRLLEKAGKIQNLTLQPRFELSVENASYPDSGERSVTLGTYIADFAYQNGGATRQREWFVEDVKGFKTPLYRWKKKHVEAQHGITVKEI